MSQYLFYPIDPVMACVEFVETELELDIKGYQNKKRQSHC
jgi:hypothetical protein